jgi:hypothetical protein
MMGNDNPEKLTQNDKIQILLQEYSTLRAELVANGTKLFQMAALTGALLTWTISRPLDKRFWIAALIGGGGLFWLGFVLIKDTRKLARRVADLERDINGRAGEELLVWESRWGRAVTGFIVMHPPLPSRPIDPAGGVVDLKAGTTSGSSAVHPAARRRKR